MKISRARALEIAAEVLSYTNPTMWNGYGEEPVSLDMLPVVVPLKDDIILKVALRPSDDGDGWMHCVDVVSEGVSIAHENCYGIDSVNNLTDMILDICRMDV